MLSTKEYSCPGYGKRIKSISGLTRHINACTSQIIQQGLLIRMQPKQDMSMPGEDDNSSEYFGSHENEKYILNEQNIEGDHRDLVGKSSDTKSRAKDDLSGRTPQDGLLASQLSSSLKEVKFSEQEFPAGKPVSNIKYHYPDFQNDNSFHPFND